jgi:hypothetical protein
MGIMNALELMAEAKETAIYRGHNVKYWNVLGGDCYSLECKDCKMSVMVKENPLPNEINVGGEAVALNCVKTVKEKKLRKK